MIWGNRRARTVHECHSEERRDEESVCSFSGQKAKADPSLSPDSYENRVHAAKGNFSKLTL
jgi:hypothetical protein